MNKGLKKWTTQIPLTIGKIGEVKININKEDANVHILLPLIKTIGLCPIKTYLIFNLQDINSSELFGKGFKLNYFKKIISDSNSINVKNADGSIDEYLSSESYINKESGFTMKKIKEQLGYEIYYKYEHEDNYGNVSFYDETQPYPLEIDLVNKDKIKSNFIAATKTISNNHGDEIRFTKNGNQFITKVEYYHNNQKLNVVELAYDTNGYLSKVIYKNNDEILASSSMSINKNEIIIKDEVSGECVKVCLENNKAASFIKGFDNIFNKGNQVSIQYNDGFSTLINSKGVKNFCFFDDKNVPIFQMTENGMVLETEYDKTTKVLKSKSKPINVKTMQNLLKNDDLTTFVSSGVSVTKVSVEDEKIANVVGQTAYKISGNGTLKKELSINGLGSDDVFAIIFGKQLTAATNNSYVEVTLTANGQDKDKFAKAKVDGQFELMSLGTSGIGSYDKITLEIKLVGNQEIVITGVKIAQKEFGSFYNYDESGNPTEICNDKKSTQVSYGSNGLPETTIGFDSISYNYEYDDYGNLTKALTAYGTNVEHIFDDKFKQNLLTTRISNYSNTKILETKRSYTDDGRFLTSKTDELGNKTAYDEYDSYGKIKKITNALNAVTEFSYNADNTLSKILFKKGEGLADLKFEYNDKKQLTKATAYNKSTYGFDYDKFGNLTTIKLNGVLIYKYIYDENTGRLIKQVFGENGDAYSFSYNNDLISEVFYESTANNKKLKYKYFYNLDNKLIKVEDESGEIIVEYGYDLDGKIVSIVKDELKINNTFDNLGNVVSKSTLISNIKHYSSYDTVERSKGSHPGSIYEPFKKTTAYIGIFEKNSDLIYQEGQKALWVVKNHVRAQEHIYVPVKREGVIPYIEVNSATRISYIMEEDPSFTQPCGSICFWFKSTTSSSSSSKKYLYSKHAEDPNDKNFLGIYLLNKRVYLEVIDYKGVVHNLLVSDYEIDLSKWNFIAFNYMSRDDGPAYGAVCEYDLMVNGHKQIYRLTDSMIYADCGFDAPVNIGHKYDGKSMSYPFSGKIACVMLGKVRYLDDAIIYKFYRLTKDYIIDNEVIDEDVRAVDFSQTNLFSINQNLLNFFDIYPLQNNVQSLTRKKPIKFNIRNLSSYDKDRTFNFNASIKRYAYVADGEDLVYNFGISDTGTICMRAFADVRETRQYLFEARDSNNHNISLYRGNDEYLYVNVNGYTLATNLKFETNKWHFAGLSFKKCITSGSNPNSYLDLRVFLDGKTWISSKSISSDFGSLEVAIGKSFTSESVYSTFGGYKTFYPLKGQIEMLTTRAAFCETTTLLDLMNNFDSLTKINEYDEFGILRKTDVHENGKSILSNTYYYKARPNNSKYISKQISSEKIKSVYFSLTRFYESDVLGNILSISDSCFGSHKYEYDYRGFLISADGEKYIYDTNGNMVKKGNKLFVYDTTIKDKLVRVADTNILYDDKNPLNPKQYGDKTFGFEGRRLVKLESDKTKIEYLYDDQGLRVEKILSSGKQYKYFYDNKNLICEITSDHRLDFLYDESGLLYGFIKNNSERYLYVKDSFQNILGIVNDAGRLLVKYKYNAWGEIQEIEDLSGSDLSHINPFRFKGYYYDEESGMYYCKSRYYVPEWCRWLNADNPNYLDFKDVNGVNLFSYCHNDPILGMDYDGRFGLGAILVAALVGAVISVISSVADSLIKGEELTLKNVISDAVGGAVSGVITFITGGKSLALASYASAAVTSLTGELYDYITGSKTLNVENLLGTMKKVISDTIVDGTVNYLSEKISHNVVPNLEIDFGEGFRRSNLSSTSLFRQVVDEFMKFLIEENINTFKDSIIKNSEDIINEPSKYNVEINPIIVFN